MNEIVREYAAGLYALAREEEIEERILTESQALAPLFTRGYTRLLSDPAIPKADRIRLVAEALDGRVHPHLVHFAQLMTERGAASEIPACFAEYEELWCADHDVVRVRAESAVELTEEQKDRLADRLSKRTGRRVIVSFEVNPALLGGMRLFYDNRQIDDTVKSRLNEIAERLKRS